LIAVADDASLVCKKILACFKLAHSKTSPTRFHNSYVLSERMDYGLFQFGAGKQQGLHPFKLGAEVLSGNQD
jgi:hypothetical protein